MSAGGSVSREVVLDQLHGEPRNWGRWGEDDQRGAINLITADKTVTAARLVRTGTTVTLSREWPIAPGPTNPWPAEQLLYTLDFPHGGGVAADYIGHRYHGFACTHIDALCHCWDDEGMWGGRRPENVIRSSGSTWADVDQWRNGIVTRGVLLDVPRYRGTDYVTLDAPVEGGELAAIAKAEDVTLQPGDALVVYSGREKWIAANPDWKGGLANRPGLDGSCLKFVRDEDIAVLCWDLMDLHTDAEETDVAFAMHGALYSYGVALVDNCYLETLAEVCAGEGRHEFLIMIAPLRIVGGTGSPTNPIAVF